MSKQSSQENEFLQLKELLNSNAWPCSIDPDLICNPSSEEEKRERASGILGFMVDSELEGKRFLDFGCGEGHLALAAKELGCLTAVGYDILLPKVSTEMQKEKGVLFTADFESVRKHGPFDLILLYDVMDHVINEKPFDILNKIRSVCAPNAKIFIRCHPWISRHGGHLYHQLNKAFAHLVFSPAELQMLNVDLTDSIKVVSPLKEYRNWFPRAARRWRPFRNISHDFLGWGIELASNLHRNLLPADEALRRYIPGPRIVSSQEIIDRQKVETFFIENSLIRKRINNNLSLPDSAALPVFNMEISFVDYVLTL